MTLTALTLASSLVFTQASQPFVFFDKKVGDWTIIGHTTGGKNASCFMRKNIDANTELMLVKDLEDGEIYAVFNNSKWNIMNKPGYYEGRITFINKEGVSSSGASVELVGKSTIRIRQINMKFMYDFSTYNKLSITLSGDVPSIDFALKDSKISVATLGQCIGKFDDMSHRLDVRKM